MHYAEAIAIRARRRRWLDRFRRWQGALTASAGSGPSGWPGRV